MYVYADGEFSFPTLKKVEDQGVLEALLRRAVVETYTNVVYGKRADEGVGRGLGERDFTREVEVVGGEDGGFRFVYKSEEVVEGILGQGQAVEADKVVKATVEATEVVEATVEATEVVDATVEAAEVTEASKGTDASAATESTEEVAAEEVAAEEVAAEEVAAEEVAAEEVAAEEVAPEEQAIEEEVVVEEVSTPPLALSPTDAWHSLPIPISHLLAIHKRLLLTTGYRLSDQALSYSPTARDLLKALRNAATPPPEKLDLLSLVPELRKLGNVRVLKSRLRPVDREVEKGRLSPAQREWLENKRRRERGEEVEGEWIYKWDEGKYFVP